ncbi:hydantoinase/oxoprolinase family protein [Sphingobium sp. SA916]|uniref:hydantoinase/oxoprolinase family protein n=1 Tax=Sphingobium sp. SA916 TaxID=1851207 RepID=UPI000C9EEAC4|nr:hydantoinase/oxoprolinase family protein [Sphingobium sp. SA916]PNQ03688.1 hypothetical protein A8G00_10695 [Sphingobium sp. SA916]
MTRGNGELDLSVAIDTGGTFTDVTLLDRASGAIWTAKVPSTPADPSEGFMNGIQRVLELAGSNGERLSQVVHGTTVATNLILESKGPLCALLTTAGFRHVLEIGRHDIPRGTNLYSWQKPARPIRPELIVEVGGRLNKAGEEVEPLDLAAVRSAAKLFKRQSVKAIAISFLHSYAADIHERAAREAVLEEWPEAIVTISSEVLPTFREFERSMATVLNAYVMPAVSTYVERLEGRLRDDRVAAPLLLMKSNGGVSSAQAIRREPVQTALSGPAAGVVGMQLFAKLAGYPDVIGVDIGGTSADISLIKGGAPGMTSQGRVGEWPLTIPMVDINTIGAGGGSIARISDSGGLTVGPDSAGAQPGPVCYSRGGTEPTVTDAHAVLGHLPATLLKGEMQLDIAAARDAIRTRIAEPLGLTIEDAARGILALADNKMVGAIRVVSVEKGYDPRDFALVPFGGAGPLHGGALARLLGMRTLLLPPSPGVLSSIGLLASNLRSDFQRTCIQDAGSPDFDALRASFSVLESDAVTWFDDEQVPSTGRSIRRIASMRYQGQGFELQVGWDREVSEADALAKALAEFHDLHEALYTFSQPEMPVEIVTVGVEAIGTLPEPPIRKLAAAGDIAAARIGEQIVHFADGERMTPIFSRSELGAGAIISGPAIFQQLDTTIVMLPGQAARIDDYGNMIITEA